MSEEKKYYNHYFELKNYVLNWYLL